MKKRIIAMCMVFCMLASLLPTALAAETDEHEHNAEGWTCEFTETSRELTCEQEEHKHTGECYATTEPELVCTVEEHTHTDECYKIEGTWDCTPPQEEPSCTDLEGCTDDVHDPECPMYEEPEDDAAPEVAPSMSLFAASDEITSAGGELESGTYELDEDVTLSESLVIPVGQTVTINLNGHTITGDDLDRVITVHGDLTINGKTDDGKDGLIIGGKCGICVFGSTELGSLTMNGGIINGDGTGRGIYCSGNLHLDGVTVKNHKLTNQDESGGGVFISVSDHQSRTFYIKNCVFEDNTASLHGGGLAYEDTLSGIYENASTLVVDGCTFENNAAGVGPWSNGLANIGTGGGVSVVGNAEITNCTFKSNNAQCGGGLSVASNPVYSNVVGRVTLTGCDIENNTAHQYGGGILAEKNLLTISGGEIIGNIAQAGEPIQTPATNVGVYPKPGIGGGVASLLSSITLKDGGVIMKNTAETAADDIYFKHALTVDDGAGGTVTAGDAAMTLIDPSDFLGVSGLTDWFSDEESARYREKPENTTQYEDGIASAKTDLYLTAGADEDVVIARKYTLTYVTNGGSGIEPEVYLEGAEVNLTMKITTRDGYDFTGWYTDDGLTNKIEDSQIDMDSDRTVYAGWKPTGGTEGPDEGEEPDRGPGFTFHFETYGGEPVAHDIFIPEGIFSYDPDTREITGEDELCSYLSSCFPDSMIPQPTLENYRFIGWTWNNFDIYRLLGYAEAEDQYLQYIEEAKADVIDCIENDDVGLDDALLYLAELEFEVWIMRNEFLVDDDYDDYAKFLKTGISFNDEFADGSGLLADIKKIWDKEITEYGLELDFDDSLSLNLMPITLCMINLMVTSCYAEAQGTSSAITDYTFHARYMENDTDKFAETTTLTYAPNYPAGVEEEAPEQVTLNRLVGYEETLAGYELFDPPAGYYQTGWNTEQDGDGTFYKFGDVLTLPESPTTLYAQWEKKSTPIIPGDTVRYIVEHYKEDAGSDGGYKLVETDYPAGKIGDTVTGTPKSYDGFQYNNDKSTASGTLKELEAEADIVVLKLYYDRVETTPIEPKVAAYQIEHYVESEDGTYTLYETVRPAGYGELGGTVHVRDTDIKTYPGFAFDPDHDGTVSSAVLAMPSEAGGELVLTTLKLYYSTDVWSDETDQTDEGGGIPDKYQVIVRYDSNNTEYGTVDKSCEVFTLLDDSKHYVASGTVTASASAACTSLSRVYFIQWEKDDVKVTEDEELNDSFEAHGGEEYTYVAVFDRKSSDSGSSGGGGGGGVTTYYTLRYESNGGTEYKEERYRSNAVVELDKVPTREGYTFTGWYADKELTDRITSIKMTTDKTVYAGWKPTGVPEWLNGDEHFAYVIGYVDGTVRPLDNISRSEVAAIFFRLLNEDIREENLTSINTFAGVNEGMWCNTSISTMAELGVVKGRTPEHFDPSAPITRAEFAAICSRFDTSRRDGDSDFTDISGHWAEAEIERAASLGWIMGYKDGTFRPENYITRAEAMTMINRVLNRLPEDEDDLLDGMNVWPDNQLGEWYYLAVQEATNSHDFTRKDDVHERWVKLTADPDWSRYQ